MEIHAQQQGRIAVFDKKFSQRFTTRKGIIANALDTAPHRKRNDGTTPLESRRGNLSHRLAYRDGAQRLFLKKGIVYLPHTLGILQVPSQIKDFHRGVTQEIFTRPVGADFKWGLPLFYHQFFERLAGVKSVIAYRSHPTAQGYRSQILTTVESPVFQATYTLADYHQREMSFLVKGRIAIKKSPLILQFSPEIEGFERTIVEDGLSGRNTLITVAAHTKRFVAIFQHQIFEGGTSKKGRIADFYHGSRNRK